MKGEITIEDRNQMLLEALTGHPTTSIKKKGAEAAYKVMLAEVREMTAKGYIADPVSE